MKVILFGATGMVGKGVLLECLDHPRVTEILALGRSPSGMTHPRLRDLVHADLYDYSSIEGDLAGWDACFFCLGVSSAGMDEASYSKVTQDLTLAAARTLRRLNPGMTFCYVSGAGTDSSEKGPRMWARVKGKTENAILGLGFKGTYFFRPGYIQPMRGIRSRTGLYRAFYAILAPLYPLWRLLLPGFVTTTRAIGAAMIRVAEQGAPRTRLEVRDINELAQ